MPRLHTKWIATLKESASIIPQPMQEKYIELIFTAYQEPHRHYHTLQHLDEMYQEYQTIRPLLLKPHELVYAQHMHDVIYRVFRIDQKPQNSNEWASADLAKSFAEEHELDLDIATVFRMIRMSEYHPVPNTHDLSEDERLFLDTDMAIFTKPWARILEYEMQITKEFSQAYNPAEYLRGRLAFLRKLEKLETIFCSQYYRDSLSNQARENIRGLIDSIRSNLPG